MSDYMLGHYINQYSPVNDLLYALHMQRICTYLIVGGYVSKTIEEDYKRRQCYSGCDFSR